MMKTYVDDILEQKSKQQKLIQALGILEIPFTKFHTLYLGDKLIELRQLFDEAMIERVRAYHHCKQTAELNCIKVTKDDFEPFLLKVLQKNFLKYLLFYLWFFLQNIFVNFFPLRLLKN